MRIAPLAESDWNQATTEAAALVHPKRPARPTRERSWRVSELPDPEWVDVLLRHPELVQAWWPLTMFMVDDAVIPPRQRELAILRVAWRCRGQYQWKAHTVMARGAGLSATDIERVRLGADGDGWSALDRAVLQAVDELHDDSRISDETWATLARHWDEQQLIELPFLVGQYHVHCYALSSFGIEVPDWDSHID